MGIVEKGFDELPMIANAISEYLLSNKPKKYV